MIAELALDIETSPIVADVWNLWPKYVGLNQVQDYTRMICFTAQWRGHKSVQFFSEHHDGTEAMVRAAWDLYNEADMIITWNGDNFDLPHLRREFLLAGLTPPSPVKSVDLMKQSKKQFRWASNKLQHVSTQLGLAGKVGTGGHELWTACLAGDDAAWKRMRKYAKQDTALLWEIYEKLLPWLDVPHQGLYGDTPDGCSNCGSLHLTKQGFYTAVTGRYQRFQCSMCGRWSRSTKREATVETRGI